VRELPREKEGGEEPAARVAEELREGAVQRGSARGCGPSHQWRDATDQSADPGVGDRQPLHGRVYPRVEEDVEGAEGGNGWVHADVECRDAESAGDTRERYRLSGAEEAANQGPILGP